MAKGVSWLIQNNIWNTNCECRSLCRLACRAAARLLTQTLILCRRALVPLRRGRQQHPLALSARDQLAGSDCAVAEERRRLRRCCERGPAGRRDLLWRLARQRADGGAARPNWTEFQLPIHATPRYPGHLQPDLPLEDHSKGFGMNVSEDDPEVMEKKIDAATSHGIGMFCSIGIGTLRRDIGDAHSAGPAGRWRRALPRRCAERRLPQGEQQREDEVRADVSVMADDRCHLSCPVCCSD